MNFASDRQYWAPNVFGMISDRKRIRSVSIAEIKPKYASPNTATAWEPTPAAPMVWATVFKVRIAAKDWSTLHFS